ncbi:MAG: ferritin-like domain-containing protein [Chloroflexota bacterium]
MNQKVIDMLNEGRQRELLAVQQYLAQHYELADQMYGKLAERMKKTGIQEMKHAETFAERILFLGGTPANKPNIPAKRGLTIPEMLDASIDLEVEAVNMYNAHAHSCEAEGDFVSMHLFESLAGEEEGHLDEFQNTKDFVDKLGAPYLATLTGNPGD